jgi:hypothetical protein
VDPTNMQGIFSIPYHQPLLQIPVCAGMPSLVWSNRGEVFFWVRLVSLYAIPCQMLWLRPGMPLCGTVNFLRLC